MTVCFPHGRVCLTALLATRVYVCLVSLVCCLPTCVCGVCVLCVCVCVCARVCAHCVPSMSCWYA